MSNQSAITLKDQTLYLSGEITFSNVMAIYQESLQHLNQLSAYQFDFSNVQKSNSAGLALIFEWKKLAKARHLPIHFTAISTHLSSIAKAAHCDHLL